MEIHKLGLERLADHLGNELRKRQIIHFLLADDIELVSENRNALLKLLDQKEHRRRHVTRMHVETASRLGAAGIGMYEETLPVKNGVNDFGNELLGMLPLAEHVHGVRDHDGEAEGIEVAVGQLLASGFGGGVGIARLVAVPLFVGHSIGCRTEDLVGTEVTEEFQTIKRPRIVEKIAGPHHVIHDEFHGILDGAVDVRRCREVEDIVHRPDAIGDVGIQGRPQIVVDEFDPSGEFLAPEIHIRKPVKRGRRINLAQTDKLPIGILQNALGKMMADEPVDASEEYPLHTGSSYPPERFIESNFCASVKHVNSVKIAVSMPAYEPKREHIRAAVESVRAQTFTDWTLLINDDASVREDTASHVQDFLTDARITFRKNPRNLGIGGNWNACLKYVFETPPLPPSSPLSTGEGGRGGEAMPKKQSEYVAFLFHDDLWEPAYLEKMIAALDAHPSAGFAAANHTYLKEGEVAASPFYEELHAFVQSNIAPGLHEHDAFLRWWMARGLKPNVIGEPSFVVLRRSLMEQVGPFNETMVQFLDSEYWARCLLRTDWVYVPETLGKFRVHPAGMSAVNEGMGRGVFERLRTLQTVVAGLPPQDKGMGNTALVNALSGMIGQYFTRRKQGRSVSHHGNSGLKRCILRHPLLVLRALMKWIGQRK